MSRTRKHQKARVESRHKALSGMVRSKVKALPTRIHRDKTKQDSKTKCRGDKII